MQRNEVGLLPHTCTKMNLNWIKSMNVRAKTVKLIEENICINPCSPELGSDVLVITKAQTKKKINCTSKLKPSCVSKGAIKIMRRQPTGWEKIFANHISDKRLIFRIY